MIKKGMVRSMRGEVVDMSAFASRNSTVVALGNANMNARGDLIDRSGKVIKSREVIVQEYYNSNPKAVSQSVSLNDLGNEVLTPAQAAALWDASKAEEAPAPTAPKKKRKIIDQDPDFDG